MSILKSLKAKSLPTMTHVISMAEQFASEHDENIETAPSLSDHVTGHRKDGAPYAFISYYSEMIRNDKDLVRLGQAAQKQKDVETLLRNDDLPYVERVRIAESQVRWLKYNLIKNHKQAEKILDIICRNSDENIINACIMHPNISLTSLEYLVDTYATQNVRISTYAQSFINEMFPQAKAA